LLLYDHIDAISNHCIQGNMTFYYYTAMAMLLRNFNDTKHPVIFCDISRIQSTLYTMLGQCN